MLWAELQTRTVGGRIRAGSAERAHAPQPQRCAGASDAFGRRQAHSRQRSAKRAQLPSHRRPVHATLVGKAVQVTIPGALRRSGARERVDFAGTVCTVRVHELRALLERTALLDKRL